MVLVISDGWNRGEPNLLQAEMAGLQRSCHRLIWLNPLLGAPAYEPATRGIQAALPYIDNLLPGHNMASLVDLAHHLSTFPTRREARRQQPVSPKSIAEGTSDTPKASQRSSHRDANPAFKHPLWGRGN